MQGKLHASLEMLTFIFCETKCHQFISGISFILTRWYDETATGAAVSHLCGGAWSPYNPMHFFQVLWFDPTSPQKVCVGWKEWVNLPRWIFPDSSWGLESGESYCVSRENKKELSGNTDKLKRRHGHGGLPVLFWCCTTITRFGWVERGVWWPTLTLWAAGLFLCCSHSMTPRQTLLVKSGTKSAISNISVSKM